jgi:Nif-specific regulatory protein
MARDRVERECELYRRILELDVQEDLAPLLAEALGLIREITGARLGYLELFEDGPRWSVSQGMTDQEVAGARAVLSRGIIAEALATEQTIVTPSALLDPRFQERRSVQRGKIEAVLCAPVGHDPPIGVLYLQDAEGGAMFSDGDRTMAELFARHLAPLADRLLVRASAESDPTAPFREALQLESVVGRSQALGDLLRQVSLVAPLDVSVLLTGESGTGKSHVARLVHDNSPRAGRPLVELNCAAIPETLIESELFGALPGAHSTATRKIDGKVAAAEGGTLFLDEVGDLSLPAQAKLLQLLQSKSYFPLGASRAVRADVRIVAATNVDLQAAVAERRFRQDLLYRLEVLPIYVPTLVQRREDVVLLAKHFCREACVRHGLAVVELSDAAIRAAQAAEWPGNVRQLAHVVEAGAIRAAGEGAKRIERRHLFPKSTDPASAAEPLTFQEATRRFQAALVRDALEDTNWSVTEVAERLDLARSYVYHLIKAFGLEKD